MDTFKYTCTYCHELYIPKRRYSQKYCSNSCRSKAYHRRQLEKIEINTLKKIKSSETNNLMSQNGLPISQDIESKETTSIKKQSVEKMSASGVGNAAAGTLLADLLKYALLGKGNQPATKNDIVVLLDKFQRYHLITNLPPRPFGKLPYFDLHTNQVVYF